MKSLKKQFASVKNTIEMEGLKISRAIEDLVLKEANGEISFNEFSSKMKAIADKA